MNKRTMVLAVSGAAVAMALLCVNGIRAQIGRTRIESDEFRVTIVNELGEWARIGMIGYQQDANLRRELRNGSYWTGLLYGGQRVVVAWDRDQNLIFAAEVLIDRNGKLRLQGVAPMEAGAGVPAEGSRPRAESRVKRSPLPQMKIE